MNLQNEYQELSQLLADPAKKIPSLSEEGIRVVLIQVLLAYIERKISFKVVLTIAKLLKQYSTISLSSSITEALKEINELENHHDILEEILTDILQELVKKPKTTS